MRQIVKIRLLLIGFIIYTGTNGVAQSSCKCTIPIDNTFQIAPMTVGFDTDIGVPPLYENNDATTPALALPFNFCFYGQSFDSVFISNNGIVSFIQPIHSFIDSEQHFPLGADTLMIAPFFADANTNRNAGVVYYKITPNYMIVIWDSVRYAGVDVDGWNTFQLIISDGTNTILTNGNNVSFCYPIMQWACSEASGGFSGYGGTPAFVGVNKGDGINYAQISTFSLPGDVYAGPFSAYNGVDWLDFQNFTLNTCVSGNVIPPIIVNERPACNKLYICPCDTTATEIALGAPDSAVSQNCDTVSLTAAFICATPGQSAVLSYSCSGPLYIYSIDTSTVNYIDSITIQIVPDYTDTGTVILSLIATDTVAHVQSTVSYTIVVTTACHNVIQPPPPPVSGIAEVRNSNYFTIYPNPAGQSLTIQCKNVMKSTTAKIFDVFGAEAFSAKLVASQSNLDVSGLARGMYFVEIFEAGTPVSVRKIILQ